jgi:hypothetical protein
MISHGPNDTCGLASILSSWRSLRACSADSSPLCRFRSKKERKGRSLTKW